MLSDNAINQTTMIGTFANLSFFIFLFIFFCVLIWACLMGDEEATKRANLPLDENDEKDKLLDHSYDGIQELDNNLPPWWKNLFYTTIVFAVIYMFGYHIFHTFNLSEAELKQELETFKNQEKTQSATNESSKPTDNPEHILQGKSTYTTYCASCHGTIGEGKIGPNLTDQYWIHGARFGDIVQIIQKGVPAKGMPNWGGILSPKKINQVSSYIMTLKGTQPNGAKAPEGKLDKGSQ